MTRSQEALIQSLPAGGAISAFRIIRGGSSGFAFQASSSTGPYLGISASTDTSSGDQVGFVATGSTTWVQAGSTISVGTNGAECTSDSTGRAVTAGSGNHVACIVLEPAFVVNQLVRCIVQNYKI
jgi:hypothetical protein